MASYCRRRNSFEIKKEESALIYLSKLLAGAWKGEKKSAVSGACNFLLNKCIEQQFGFVWWFVCLRRRRASTNRAFLKWYTRHRCKTS